MSRDLLAHLFPPGTRRPRHKLVVHHRDDVHKTKGGAPAMSDKRWVFKDHEERKRTTKAAAKPKTFTLVRKGEKPRPPDPNANQFKIVRKGADPERQARLDADLRKSRRASTEREPFVRQLDLDGSRVEKGSGWSSHLFADHGPDTVALGYDFDDEARKRADEDLITRETAKRLRRR